MDYPDGPPPSRTKQEISRDAALLKAPNRLYNP